jgi:hypothetical protein
MGDAGAGSSNPTPSTKPLDLDSMHRASGFRIPEGPIYTKSFRIRQHEIKLNWYDEYEEYFVNAGLFKCHQLGKMWVDKRLMTALVERWRKETHTFHMPRGEMTITLQDVSYLLGLTIYGKPMCLRTDDRNWELMVHNLLGVEPDSTTFRKGSKNLIRKKW